jgi:hypothetical protein
MDNPTLLKMRVGDQAALLLKIYFSDAKRGSKKS